MQKLKTNFVDGQPFLAEHMNKTNAAVNKLMDESANAVSLTYQQLVALKTAEALIAGQSYRITDYETVVSGELQDVRSAGHPFDLLVVAIDAKTLSEKAKAMLHDADEYFADAKLEAWEVWYCIDNDTKRFAWADEANGKGVIYRLIDEYNNDCPYDFKNIQFKRWAITNIESTSLTQDALSSLRDALVYDNNGGKCFATKDAYGEWVPADSNGTEYVVDENTFDFYYTFQGMSTDDGETVSEKYDMSAHPLKLSDGCIDFLVDEGSGANLVDECHDNVLKPAFYEYFSDDEYTKGRQVLNNVVFLNGLSYCYFNEDEDYWDYNTSSCYGNVFGVECKNSTFGNNCTDNTFGNYCYSNTFGNSFQYNTFGNNCTDNTFGNDCYYNTFGNGCSSNTFGNSFRYNTFGNGCSSNTFGNGCSSNTFGNNCFSNTFGNNCYGNTAGNYFQNNTFGNGCYYNTFGNYCYSNTFGNNCTDNTFGNDCYRNTFGNYVQTITVFDGVQYVSVTGGASSSSYVQNAQILNGTQGTDSNNKLQISFVANKKYTQIAALNSSGNLVVWTPADV